MFTKQKNKNKKSSHIAKEITERTDVKIGIVVSIILVLGLFLSVVNLNPNLSHLKVTLLSGPQNGYYYTIAEKLSQMASWQKGTLINQATHGSMDNRQNILHLKKDSNVKCKPQFAIVQDGLQWNKDKVQLVAHLPIWESVFFLGKNADQYSNINQLQGKTIGIGPKGSGTAYLAQILFLNLAKQGLAIQMKHFSIKEQMSQLTQGKIDLGIFVIHQDIAFIRKAIVSNELKIASFAQLKAIAQKNDFLDIYSLGQGYFHMMQNIPKQPTSLLRVRTMLVANECVPSAQIIAMLTLLDRFFPQFIDYNRNVKTASSDLHLTKVAEGFFANGGPAIWDEYLPWLADYLPFGNLVQILMAISILFNIMGFGHRFRLWRIDARRVYLERMIEEGLSLSDDANTIDMNHLEQELAALYRSCRKHSVSMLVPMGQEMAYRYQENLIQKNLTRINAIKTNRQ